MMNEKQLGITTQELEALKLVRNGLASGHWKHVEDIKKQEAGQCSFNMGYSMMKTHGCGTVACIGGWMGIGMGMTQDETNSYVNSYQHSFGAFSQIFFPRIDGNMYAVNYKKITDEHAVKAIDNFLETGNPDWDSILGADQRLF